jgi:hypothetical protein
MQPLRLALALGDLRAPIAGQLAQVADRLGRHEARPEQAASASWHSHAASDTSVLRPGTNRCTD